MSMKEIEFTGDTNMRDINGPIKFTLIINVDDRSENDVRLGFVIKHGISVAGWCSIPLEQSRDLKKWIELQLFARKLQLE